MYLGPGPNACSAFCDGSATSATSAQEWIVNWAAQQARQARARPCPSIRSRAAAARCPAAISACRPEDQGDLTFESTPCFGFPQQAMLRPPFSARACLPEAGGPSLFRQGPNVLVKRSGVGMRKKEGAFAYGTRKRCLDILWVTVPWYSLQGPTS